MTGTYFGRGRAGSAGEETGFAGEETGFVEGGAGFGGEETGFDCCVGSEDDETRREDTAGEVRDEDLE